MSFAQALLTYSYQESIVTALYGDWGSGKSSVINMTIEHIETSTKDLNKYKKPIIVRFNPWNYSDQNQLVLQFFRALSFSLQRDDFGEQAREAGEKLETYSNFFTPLALIPDPTAGVLSVVFQKLFNSVGKAAKVWGAAYTRDLVASRQDLNKALAKQERKIIIVVDDIDRLNNAEIRQIFQLVKTLGDFPNTIYLLAFDRSVVINALKKVQEGPGEEYLEKVIQIPFELPGISKEEVEKLLFSQLGDLIKDIPESKWDQTYWGNIYHSGLKHFFTNIRDVTRYINSLRFSFAMVREEVNPIDFLAITALQVFEPGVHQGLRDNKDMFSGALGSGHSRAAEVEQAKKRCNEILDRSIVLNQDQVKELLSQLFPKLESIYGNMGYGYDWLESWRRSSRVCSPDIFDIYFRLSVPKGEISQKEIEAVLGLTSNKDAFAEALLKLIEDGRVVRFLERMEDYTRDIIPENDIESIIIALMDIGDLFPEGRQGMFETGTQMRILRLSYQLSQRFNDQAKRYEIFRNAITNAKESIYTIAHEVSVQGQQHGKYTSKKEQLEPEEKRTVNSKQLEDLEKLACGKIQQWAEAGRLKDHPKLISILYDWEKWCLNGKHEVNRFVRDLIATDVGLIGFVSACVGKSFVHGMSDYDGRVEWKISTRVVEDFIPIEEIDPRIRNMVASEKFKDLSPDQQRALTTFVDTVDGKVKER